MSTYYMFPKLSLSGKDGNISDLKNQIQKNRTYMMVHSSLNDDHVTYGIALQFKAVLLAFSSKH